MKFARKMINYRSLTSVLDAHGNTGAGSVFYFQGGSIKKYIGAWRVVCIVLYENCSSCKGIYFILRDLKATSMSSV